MIIQQFSVPYTDESQLLGTACSTSLATASYAPAASDSGWAQIANQALISVGGANVRYKLNGSSPATSCGHLLVVGDALILNDINQIENMKLLNEGALATAYLYVTYFVG